MERQARIAAKVEHARVVERYLQWLGWSVAVLGVLGVIAFAVLWADGSLGMNQAVSLILGTAGCYPVRRHRVRGRGQRRPGRGAAGTRGARRPASPGAGPAGDPAGEVPG